MTEPPRITLEKQASAARVAQPALATSQQQQQQYPIVFQPRGLPGLQRGVQRGSESKTVSPPRTYVRCYIDTPSLSPADVSFRYRLVETVAPLLPFGLPLPFTTTGTGTLQSGAGGAGTLQSDEGGTLQSDGGTAQSDGGGIALASSSSICCSRVKKQQIQATITTDGRQISLQV